jgi:type VI secretion system protein ImpK
MALIDCFLPPLAFAAMLGSEPNLADTPYETARTDMDRLLDQALEKARLERPDQAEDAFFAVCAFVDEAVLDSPWPGRGAWMGRKLQQVRLLTANAGVEFYEHLERLCAEAARGGAPEAHPDEERARLRDQGLREVIEVYAACLTLGFTGRYADDRARIDQLTDATLQHLATIDGSQQDKVFPQVYDAALPAPAVPRFKSRQRMLLVFGAPLLLAAGLYALYGMLLSDFVRRWLAALA